MERLTKLGYITGNLTGKDKVKNTDRIQDRITVYRQRASVQTGVYNKGTQGTVGTGQGYKQTGERTKQEGRTRAELRKKHRCATCKQKQGETERHDRA